VATQFFRAVQFLALLIPLPQDGRSLRAHIYMNLLQLSIFTKQKKIVSFVSFSEPKQVSLIE